MRCLDIEHAVDSFIDDELAEPERLEFSTHLSDCAPCRRLVQEQASFKTALRLGSPRPEAPPDLSRRVQDLLDEEDRRAAAAPPPPLSPRARLWRIVAPVAVLGAALLLSGPRVLGSRESAVIFDSIAKHQRDLPLEITGAPEDVRSWFDGKVPFAVPAPRLLPRASLLGGRLISVGDREAAYLIYELGGRKVSLFVFDAHDLPFAAPRRQVVGHREVYLEGARGYHVALFRDNGVGYAITGTMEEPDLLRLVSTMSDP